jgi:hypothetical protein
MLGGTTFGEIGLPIGLPKAGILGMVRVGSFVLGGLELGRIKGGADIFVQEMLGSYLNPMQVLRCSQRSNKTEADSGDPAT